MQIFLNKRWNVCFIDVENRNEDYFVQVCVCVCFNVRICVCLCPMFQILYNSKFTGVENIVTSHQENNHMTQFTLRF